eukprot:GILJ01008968.1.p1 GENE.GILJ01008968.1~~GILJ01008968.1.p1  ORF type:complete len:844 (+),score=127.17 GILJ01008968.1:68-2533(+)
MANLNTDKTYAERGLERKLQMMREANSSEKGGRFILQRLISDMGVSLLTCIYGGIVLGAVISPSNSFNSTTVERRVVLLIFLSVFCVDVLIRMAIARRAYFNWVNTLDACCAFTSLALGAADRFDLSVIVLLRVLVRGNEFWSLKILYSTALTSTPVLPMAPRRDSTLDSHRRRSMNPPVIQIIDDEEIPSEFSIKKPTPRRVGSGLSPRASLQSLASLGSDFIDMSRHTEQSIAEHLSSSMVSSPVEQVIEFLRSLKNSESVDLVQYDMLDWCIDMISSNKLYDSVMQVPTISADPDVRNDDQESFQYLLNAFTGTDTGPVNRMANMLRTTILIKSVMKKKLQRIRSKRKRLSMMHQASHFATSIITENLLSESDVNRVLEVLKGSESWEFDIFALKELTQGNELSVMALHIFQEYDLIDEFCLSIKQVKGFVTRIQNGYLKDIPYHTATHGADVMQTMLYFLTTGGMMDAANVNKLEFLACIFAAMIHDFEHPGYNNVFQVRARQPLALKYNDRAVLENHHVASVFTFLRAESDECNFLCSLNDEQFALLREIVIGAVLATDMSHHFPALGLFKSKLQSNDFMTFEKKEDRHLLFNFALHAADVSNPAKPKDIYLNWVSLVMEEFFRQGDEEKRLGLPISMFMDRSTANVAKCQFGFIDVIVQPLFAVAQQVLPNLSVVCAQLSTNFSYWQTILEEDNNRSAAAAAKASLMANKPFTDQTAMAEAMTRRQNVRRSIVSIPSAQRGAISLCNVMQSPQYFVKKRGSLSSIRSTSSVSSSTPASMSALTIGSPYPSPLPNAIISPANISARKSLSFKTVNI